MKKRIIKRRTLDFYSERIFSSLEKVIATSVKGKEIRGNEAFICCADMIKKLKQNKGKLIFIGNGGSSSIASHQAVDYWKNGKIKATAFNDPALLTCISNDYGYDQVFAKPLEFFAEPNDIIMAISSSGQSKNIINAVKAARKIKCKIITFSGFTGNNPLRKLGDINFYIPSSEYGVVEISHLLISHSILDHIMGI